MLGPKSRYRIYGGWSNYAQSFYELSFGHFFKAKSLEQLENKFVTDFRAGHAAAMPLCRMGIHLAIKYFCKRGQKVLLSPYTIADIINMVIAAGAIPHFVDVEPSSGNLSPSALKDALQQSDIGAILVTHLHGICTNMEAIAALAKENRIPLIEDCAQSLGAKIGNQYAGTIGDAGVYSLGTYKNINAWYGGMLVSQDAKLIEFVKTEMAPWPLFSKIKIFKKALNSLFIDLLSLDIIFKPLTHRIFRYGFIHGVAAINKIVSIELDTRRHDQIPAWYQSKLSPSQARLALRQWPSLATDTKTRIEWAGLYATQLKTNENFRKPPAPEQQSNIYTYYPLQYTRRKNLLLWLMHFHRDIAPQHLKNCAHLESFSAFHKQCPIAESVASSVILLPTYPSYSRAEVEKNIAIINWYIQNGEPEFSLAKA